MSEGHEAAVKDALPSPIALACDGTAHAGLLVHG